jgi:hypothetical protein
VIRGKTKLLIILTWNKKNVNPNGDNVVASNSINFNFFLFENGEK